MLSGTRSPLSARWAVPLAALSPFNGESAAKGTAQRAESGDRVPLSILCLCREPSGNRQCGECRYHNNVTHYHGFHISLRLFVNSSKPAGFDLLATGIPDQLFFLSGEVPKVMKKRRY